MVIVYSRCKYYSGFSQIYFFHHSRWLLIAVCTENNFSFDFSFSRCVFIIFLLLLTHFHVHITHTRATVSNKTHKKNDDELTETPRGLHTKLFFSCDFFVFFYFYFSFKVSSHSDFVQKISSPREKKKKQQNLIFFFRKSFFYVSTASGMKN